MFAYVCEFGEFFLYIELNFYWSLGESGKPEIKLDENSCKAKSAMNQLIGDPNPQSAQQMIRAKHIRSEIRIFSFPVTVYRSR